MNKFETADGAKIVFQDEGNGKPIVFIHGLFGDKKTFKEIIKVVSKEFRCISYDHRGHGESVAVSGFYMQTLAKDLRELIVHLELKEVTLVGYSLGALSIFSFIEQFGCKLIEKMILIDITPKMVNDSNWRYGLYRGEYFQEHLEADCHKIQTDFLGFTSFFTYRNMTKFSEKRAFKKKATLLSKALARLTIGNNPSVQKLCSELWRDIAGQDYREALSKINVPTAVFYADPGSLFTPETAKFIDFKIPAETQLVPFQNASHALVFSHAKQVATEIIQFMKAYMGA